MWLGKNFPSRQVSLSLGNRKYIALRKQIKSNQNRNKWQGPALRARSGVLKIRKIFTNKQTKKQTNRQTDRETNYRGPSNCCTDGTPGGVGQQAEVRASRYHSKGVKV